jgi:hypothetical protein
VTNPLVGHWQLVSFSEARHDGTIVDVFGPDPRGFISYLASGHMSVVFASADRAPFSGAWDEVTADEKAARFDGLVAYSGRYTLHDDRVVHHVDVCWIPNWEGRDLERFVTFLEDGTVRLRTPASRFGRSQPIQDVTLRRASPWP